jgi:putative phosphoesterase
MTHIGLLSDTHVPHRQTALPPALFDRFSGVDLILHAGDLVDPAILDQLCQIAPVQAVRGNVHFLAPWPHDQHLPLHLDLEIAGQRIVVTHGHLSFWRSIWEKIWMLWPDNQGRANARMLKDLPRAFPGADVYVFGHSHRALVERRDGALFVNPGAACPTRNETPSVARLVVTPGSVEATILTL